MSQGMLLKIVKANLLKLILSHPRARRGGGGGGGYPVGAKL
jgi:hypothetical protein